MELDYQEIGNNIRYFRKKQHLRQQQLAELVAASPGHISHIECGHAKMSTELLVLISQALSVSIYSLLGDNVSPPPNESFDKEMNTILQQATPAQRELCLELCRTVIEIEKRIK